MCTCAPHPEPFSYSLPIPYLWVVPVHRLWVPCFMNQTWTGFTEGDIHISMLFSQTIPPLPDCKEHSNASCNLSCHIVVPMARNTLAVKDSHWVGSLYFIFSQCFSMIQESAQSLISLMLGIMHLYDFMSLNAIVKFCGRKKSVSKERHAVP